MDHHQESIREIKEWCQEMLIIESTEVIDNKNLKIVKRRTKKTQILLYDTQRRLDDFFNKLKYRNNGNYEDVPHYVISKIGTIYNIFNPQYSSKTFDEPQIDKRIIKVALENLGWLNKNTITGFLNNWIGDPYRSDPYIRNWREYYFWDKYGEQQLESTANLCEYLCDKHNIKKQIVPSQGYLENITKFNGVVCKSNYSNIYTDINPSFNFKIFFKNEKQIDRI